MNTSVVFGALLGIGAALATKRKSVGFNAETGIRAVLGGAVGAAGGSLLAEKTASASTNVPPTIASQTVVQNSKQVSQDVFDSGTNEGQSLDLDEVADEGEGEDEDEDEGDDEDDEDDDNDSDDDDDEYSDDEDDEGDDDGEEDIAEERAYSASQATSASQAASTSTTPSKNKFWTQVKSGFKSESAKINSGAKKALVEVQNSRDVNQIALGKPLKSLPNETPDEYKARGQRALATYLAR